MPPSSAPDTGSSAAGGEQGSEICSGTDAGLDVSLQQALICVQEKGETGDEG